MTTPNQNKVTEEEQKDNERFEELKKKGEEVTDDEKKEITELKDRYGKRMQKKIDKMNWEKKTLEENLEAEKEARRKDKEAQDARIANLEKGKEETVTGDKSATVDIAGKKWFTDEALIAQIKSGDITEQDAYKYQRKRDKEEVKLEIKSDLEKEKKETSDNEIRVSDAEKVLKSHPEFDKKHPDHNPEDPLFKMTTDIYKEGYASNPKGLSLAVKRAKQILRMTDSSPDREDLNLDTSGAPPRTPKRTESVTLTDGEKEAAERMYTRVENPRTARLYTVQEAHIKALEAKKNRPTRRV